MKRLRAPAVRIVILGTSLLAALAVTTEAGDRPPARPCSNETLNGPYGFYRAGSTSAGPLAAVGLIVFDGHGNSMATQSISRDGAYSFDVEFPGLYDVGEDCTGKGFTIEGQEFVRLVVVDDGNGILMFSESSGNSVYGVGTRTHKHD